MLGGPNIWVLTVNDPNLPWNCVHVLVIQSCPTLCDSMDCSPPGSSVYGISQARLLEWVAVSFSRESSGPRDWTQVSCIAGKFFTIEATREALYDCLNCVYVKGKTKKFELSIGRIISNFCNHNFSKILNLGFFFMEKRIFIKVWSTLQSLHNVQTQYAFSSLSKNKIVPFSFNAYSGS